MNENTRLKEELNFGAEEAIGIFFLIAHRIKFKLKPSDYQNPVNTVGDVIRLVDARRTE